MYQYVMTTTPLDIMAFCYLGPFHEHVKGLWGAHGSCSSLAAARPSTSAGPLLRSQLQHHPPLLAPHTLYISYTVSTRPYYTCY